MVNIEACHFSCVFLTQTSLSDILAIFVIQRETPHPVFFLILFILSYSVQANQTPNNRTQLTFIDMQQIVWKLIAFLAVEISHKLVTISSQQEEEANVMQRQLALNYLVRDFHFTFGSIGIELYVEYNIREKHKFPTHSYDLGQFCMKIRKLAQ